MITGFIRGTDRDDFIFLTPDTNLAYGDRGNDVLQDSAADDIMYGGSGRDTLFSTGGRDFLFGDKGADVFVVVLDTPGTFVSGGRGNDTLYLLVPDGMSLDDVYLDSIENVVLI